MRSVLVHSIAALALVVCSLAAGAPAAAEEQVLVLDPEATRITFSLKALLHTVEGSFELRSGEIRFDTDTGSAGGRVVVDAASGATGSRRRDRRMHREVLLSERHPLFVLHPTGIEGGLSVAGGGVMLRGELEAYGARHPVEITAFVEPAGNGRIRATGDFDVPYVAWGMRDVSNLLLRVAEVVEVRIEAMGELTTPEPAPRADSETGDPDPQAEPADAEPPAEAPPARAPATPAKGSSGDDSG